MEDRNYNSLCVLVTYKCNKNCPYCLYSGIVENESKEFIKPETFKHGLDWVIDNGKNGVFLTGGEPTLHPNLIELASMANEREVGVSLFTNYTQPDILRILDASSNIDEIYLTFYEQENLPKQSDFHAKVIITATIWKSRFTSLTELDKFIASKEKLGVNLVFQTLKPTTKWATDNMVVDYLEDLLISTPDENKFLWNGKQAIIYRNSMIKFNDKKIKHYQHYNMLIDGTINEHHILQGITRQF